MRQAAAPILWYFDNILRQIQQPIQSHRIWLFLSWCASYRCRDVVSPTVIGTHSYCAYCGCWPPTRDFAILICLQPPVTSPVVTGSGWDPFRIPNLFHHYHHSAILGASHWEAKQYSSSAQVNTTNYNQIRRCYSTGNSSIASKSAPKSASKNL